MIFEAKILSNNKKNVLNIQIKAQPEFAFGVRGQTSGVRNDYISYIFLYKRKSIDSSD